MSDTKLAYGNSHDLIGAAQWAQRSAVRPTRCDVQRSQSDCLAVYGAVPRKWLSRRRRDRDAIR